MIKTVLKIVMAAFYIFAGVNHFRNPASYLNLMPPYLPAHEAAVVWSGVAELTLGLLILWPRHQWLAAWGIVAMLIAFLPVHVHMLVNSHLYPETPVALLWLRFPMQALLVAWAYWYTRVSRRVAPLR